MLKVYVLLNPSSFDTPVGAYMRKRDAKKQFHVYWPNSPYKPKDFIREVPVETPAFALDEIAKENEKSGGD